MTQWSDHIRKVAQQIVKIETDFGSGTGFVHFVRKQGACCIATAMHVLEGALKDHSPICVYLNSGRFIFGENASTVVIAQADGIDSASLCFISKEVPKPVVPTISPKERTQIIIGMEVGWLGYPGLEGVADRLCFFSGRISAIDESNHRYLLDGTAIPGVSGGPAFCEIREGLRIIGKVVHYIPVSAKSDSGKEIFIPGLAGIVDVAGQNAIEDALSKLPEQKQISFTFSYDACPKCGEKLVFRKSSTIPILSCSSGCGPISALIDHDFENFPGGIDRFNELIYENLKEQVKEV